MKKLTVFEETVLLAIYRLKDSAYSVTIHEKILEMTGKDVIVGALFNTLKQMDRKGYLIKEKVKPPNEKGGKSIVLYSISSEGFRSLEQTRSMHNKLWEEIPEVLYKNAEKNLSTHVIPFLIVT